MNSPTLQPSRTAFNEIAMVDFRTNERITCFNPAKLPKANMCNVGAFNQLRWIPR